MPVNACLLQIINQSPTYGLILVMFTKAFKTKSNTAIKGSDRRKLRADITTVFPSLTTEVLSELMPAKEEMNIVKAYAGKGESVTIYARNRNPVMFELERNLYPTVYTLWSYPDLLPAFTTWPLVLEKLIGGADLMLPGVVVPPSGLPEVHQGSLCAINLVGNRAPVAIGVATMSTSEMLASGMKGKGITVLHTYRDQLWAFGDKSCPPVIPPLQKEPVSVEDEDEQVATNNSLPDNPNLEEEMQSLRLIEDEGATAEEVEETVGCTQDGEEMEDMLTCKESPQEAMDNLLHQCFFHAVKHKVKKSDLPLLTSAFLRNYIFPCCPEGKQLDIKKTSYKKMSKFLQAMQQQKILLVKELTKGVESIVEIDWKHPDIQTFIVPIVSLTSEILDGGGEFSFQAPEITSLYSISTKMMPLFQDTGHRKGDLLTQSDVRSIIITYVKTNELVDPNNKNFVVINPILCDCLLEKAEYNTISALQWDTLFARCLERMQHSYKVSFPGHSPVIHKGQIKPIDISVAQRGSNKKVTVVKNLELYGLDPTSVGNILQQRVQASASCTLLPGSKDRAQLQIQGNQVFHIGKLLLEDFKLPRKYVDGLQLAVKVGKKK